MRTRILERIVALGERLDVGRLQHVADYDQFVGQLRPADLEALAQCYAHVASDPTRDRVSFSDGQFVATISLDRRGFTERLQNVKTSEVRLASLRCAPGDYNRPHVSEVLKAGSGEIVARRLDSNGDDSLFHRATSLVEALALYTSYQAEVGK